MIPLQRVFDAFSEWIQAATDVTPNKIVKKLPPNNSPEPTGLFFMVSFGNAKRVGQVDHVGYPNEGEYAVNAQRQIPVSIHAFGANAYEQLSAVDMSRDIPTIQAILSAAEIGVIRSSEVRDLSALKSARVEGRAQMDVFIYAGVMLTQEVNPAQQLDYTLEIEDADEIAGEIT